MDDARDERRCQSAHSRCLSRGDDAEHRTGYGRTAPIPEATAIAARRLRATLDTQ